jgi:hypothetical protein
MNPTMIRKVMNDDRCGLHKPSKCIGTHLFFKYLMWHTLGHCWWHSLIFFIRLVEIFLTISILSLLKFWYASKIFFTFSLSFISLGVPRRVERSDKKNTLKACWSSDSDTTSTIKKILTTQVRALWLLIWWPLEVYMVVNFRARGISRGARKLARTPTLN